MITIQQLETAASATKMFKLDVIKNHRRTSSNIFEKNTKW